MARGKAFVRLSPKKPAKRWKVVVRDFEKDFRQIVKKVQSRGLKLVRQNVPVSTGRLRDSFRSRSKINSRLEGEVIVESPLRYAEFVNRGTAPSLGRYVPVLDRRIRTGVHPGIIGTRYLEKTEKEMQKLTNTELKSFITRVQRSVRRRYPRNKRGSRV